MLRIRRPKCWVGRLTKDLEILEIIELENQILIMRNMDMRNMERKKNLALIMEVKTMEWRNMEWRNMVMRNMVEVMRKNMVMRNMVMRIIMMIIMVMEMKDMRKIIMVTEMRRIMMEMNMDILNMARKDMDIMARKDMDTRRFILPMNLKIGMEIMAIKEIMEITDFMVEVVLIVVDALPTRWFFLDSEVWFWES